MNSLAAAQKYLAAGFSIIPIKPDGSKRADLDSWKPYTGKHPTTAQAQAWFPKGRKRGVAIIAGKISDNLEILDFDDTELIEPFRELVNEHAPGLLAKLVVVRSPRGGQHLYYRCEKIGGNQKLALRAVPIALDTLPRLEDGSVDEAAAKQKYVFISNAWHGIHTLIETRGEGGYILAPGCPPECHPSGRTYDLIQGNFDKVPMITREEREILLAGARSFNEYVKESKQVRPERNSTNGLRPGEDFNQRGDVRALLEKHGWSRCGSSSVGERWKRPDGDRPSGTLFRDGGFYVFSTNAPPFEFDRAYSPFSCVALLEYGGDFHAAAKALAAEGYGDPKAQVDSQPEEWQPLQPLPTGLRNVPELSESLIPEALRGWICDIADRLQVAPDFPAATAITGLGAVIGSQNRLRPKQKDDWQVVPNVWGMVVGPPSAMKSPAMAQALKPLYRLNHAAREKFEQESTAFEFTKEKIQAQREAQRKQMRKILDKDPEASLESFKAIALEAPPVQRRFLTNDVTVEKLGELLEENPNGILIVRDELTGWLNGLEDERAPQDRPFYLSAWESAEGYDYQRITRGSLWIPNVTISIFGGIQPSKIAPYLRRTLDGSNDDGLMQRFQMGVFPVLPEDWEYVDRWPDSAAKNRACEVFEKLADFIPTGAKADEDGKSYLHFTGEAQEFFVEWYTDLMTASPRIEHPALQSHWLKYAKLMPSLALIFHLSEITNGAVTEGVPLHCAEMAAAWCDYLWEHAQKIYGVAINAEYGLARSIAIKLQRGALKDGFTARDLWVKNWTGLDSSERVRKPLDILAANHWLREIEERQTTGGRPTVRYQINPRIREVSL